MKLYLRKEVEEYVVDPSKPLDGPKAWKSLIYWTGVSTFFSYWNRLPDDEDHDFKRKSCVVEIDS